MSQLSAQSIRSLCVGVEHPMLSEFSDAKIVVNGKSYGNSAASYDVRIDHDLTLGVNPAFLIQEAILDGTLADPYMQDILKDKLLENPPMTALANTVEDFWMPDNVVAYVVDKSTYARVFTSAFNTLIDPGFKGNLTLELVNFGDKPVVYKKGDPVCQIVFHWLDKTTDRPYAGKYQHQERKPQPAILEVS